MKEKFQKFSLIKIAKHKASGFQFNPEAAPFTPGAKRSTSPEFDPEVKITVVSKTCRPKEPVVNEKKALGPAPGFGLVKSPCSSPASDSPTNVHKHLHFEPNEADETSGYSNLPGGEGNSKRCWYYYNAWFYYNSASSAPKPQNSPTNVPNPFILDPERPNEIALASAHTPHLPQPLNPSPASEYATTAY